MNNPTCEVVKFSAEDDYIYTGLLFKSINKSKKTIIHIHGMCGNMLSFSSLLDLAYLYVNEGYNLLTFDLKAHDCIAEGNWGENAKSNDYFYYVGGSLESFERCVIDIQSAIDFCHQFSDTIILQGHSMGCERIITYQIITKQYFHTILLSPCDAYKLQEDYIFPLNIQEQIELLNQYDDEDLLPQEFFGIKNKKEKYTIPITKKALLSILTGYALKVFNQKENLDFYLPISCICVIGLNDQLQTYDPEKAFEILKNKFMNFRGCSLPGDHELIPMQAMLVDVIKKWLATVD